MNSALQRYYGTRAARRPVESDPFESQVRLQLALRTLRGIRQRYEIERARNSDAHSLTMHVAVGYADICWIDAAIEVLEESIAGSAIDAAGAAAQAHPET